MHRYKFIDNSEQQQSHTVSTCNKAYIVRLLKAVFFGTLFFRGILVEIFAVVNAQQENEQALFVGCTFGGKQSNLFDYFVGRTSYEGKVRYTGR